MTSKRKIHPILLVIVGEVIFLILLFCVIWNKMSAQSRINITVLTKDMLDFPNKHSSFFPNYYEPKPNTFQYGGEKWLLPYEPIYKINADTLHETKNYSIQKQSNTFRIVTIGDSFTFGMYVNTEDNWTELLEANLNKNCTKKNYEVINLGVYGYDLAYSEYRYQRKGDKYTPDLVLFLLKDDDFEEVKDITARVKWNFIANFKKDPKNVNALKNDTIDIELTRKAAAEGEKEIRKYYTESEVIDYQINYLQKLIDFKRKLLIFNLFEYPMEERDKIVRTVKDAPWVTFEPEKLKMKELERPPYNYLPYDSHINKKGNVLMAQKLFNYLITDMHIPCK